MEIFGYEITRKVGAATDEEVKAPSFTPKAEDDGAMTVIQGSHAGSVVDIDGTIASDSELITRYRAMSDHPALDVAITSIVNEAIINEPENDTVQLDLEKIETLPNATKEKIEKEFKNILRLFNFDMNGYEIFRRWYVDGRLYYHAMIDPADIAGGVKEFRYIDPRKIRLVRQIKTAPAQNNSRTIQGTQANAVRSVEEYYVFSEKGFAKEDLSAVQNAGAAQGMLKISKDAIIHITSGQMDARGKSVVSYLHKAIRPLNQLTMQEDSMVIYRLARAPERRVFYVDVSGMPRAKGEQYLRQTMQNFKNKVVYDSTTGEVKDSRKFATMFEDFWLARRDGGKGTEITTLPGGQNLGDIEDIVYMQKRLYQALNVPVSRVEPEAMYSLGRATEISRDEIGFEKFITRLRARFSILILNALRLQLLLKRIISQEDWDDIKNDISFKYAKDNLFAELKDTEMWNGRLMVATQFEPYIGRYFSNEWVRRNIFKQSEEQMDEEDKRIIGEEGMNQYEPKMLDGGPGGGPQGGPGQSDPNSGDLTEA